MLIFSRNDDDAFAMPHKWLDTPRSDVSLTGHHDIWCQATHVTVVINATTNCKLERPKLHYPPPPLPLRDNVSDKHLS